MDQKLSIEPLQTNKNSCPQGPVTTSLRSSSILYSLPVYKAPVHIFKQSDLNPPQPRAETCLPGTRSYTLFKTGMSQSTIGKHLGEKRSVVRAIMRKNLIISLESKHDSVNDKETANPEQSWDQRKKRYTLQLSMLSWIKIPQCSKGPPALASTYTGLSKESIWTIQRRIISSAKETG